MEWLFYDGRCIIMALCFGGEGASSHRAAVVPDASNAERRAEELQRRLREAE